MFYSRQMAVGSAYDVVCVRLLFMLLKSLVKALVNIQYLSYLHQDLDFSCSLMQFKDLHSCAELPWKQSFFPLLPEIRQINRANPPRQRRKRSAAQSPLRKAASVPVSTWIHTQLFLSRWRIGPLLNSALELSINGGIYKLCRNLSIPPLHTH